MNMKTNQGRERVIAQVLDATTLSEISTAHQVLRDWMTTHPEEQGMRDGFEQLSLMQDVAEAEEAERALTADGVVSAGEAA